MNRSTACSLVAVLSLSLLGCGTSLPDAYGIYADTNHGRVPLKGQNTQSAGNIMSYYSGVAGPSGAEFGALKQLIVYEKDATPSAIGLAKLQFLKEGAVSNIFSTNRTKVNLWVPEKDQIEFDVKPVEQRRDMYILTPRKHLDNGFYALYMGHFGGEFPGSQSQVYDFVVGSASDYPAYATALTNLQNDVKANGPALIEKMNELLNRGDYQHLADVYRPGGKALSGADLEAFEAGNQTLRDANGKIEKSELVSVTPVDESNARCTVKTTYEKTGPEQETVTIRKIGDEYFVTELK